MEIRETLSEEDQNRMTVESLDRLESAIDENKVLWEHLLQDKDISAEKLMPLIKVMRGEAAKALIGRLFRSFYPETELQTLVMIGTADELKEIELVIERHAPSMANSEEV